MILEKASSSNGPCDAEKRLIGCVIIRALRDSGYKLNSHWRMSRRGERQNAIRWLSCKSEVPFSFKWCCDALSIDHDRMLKEIASKINFTGGCDCDECP